MCETKRETADCLYCPNKSHRVEEMVAVTVLRFKVHLQPWTQCFPSVHLYWIKNSGEKRVQTKVLDVFIYIFITINCSGLGCRLFFCNKLCDKKVSLSVADIRNHIHFIKKILHKWCGWLKTTLQIWSIKISLKKCPKNWKCLYLTITKYAVIKRYLITESAWSHVTKKHILLCCMIELRTYISDTNGISGLNYITNSIHHIKTMFRHKAPLFEMFD